jgi:hypothetical protein
MQLQSAHMTSLSVGILHVDSALILVRRRVSIATLRASFR